MASIEITGFITGCKYNENNVVVTLSENRRGYKRANGTYVNDSVLTWRVTYKAYFKKYISSTFGSGMYVTVKGVVLPYVISNEGEKDGYTIIGQTIDLAAFPKNVRREQKMIKESQAHATDTPDLETYMLNDF